MAEDKMIRKQDCRPAGKKKHKAVMYRSPVPLISSQNFSYYPLAVFELRGARVRDISLLLDH